jgi:hypothetical protein
LEARAGIRSPSSTGSQGGEGGISGQGAGMGGQGGGMGGQGAGMGGQGGGMGGQGAGMGASGEGGPGAQGGMGGPGGQGGGEGAQGGQGGQGGAEGGGEVSAEMKEMEKSLADGLDAMNQGNIEAAKSKLAEVTTKYPDAKAAEMAKQILAELGVIGTAAPAITVDSWLQGKGDLTTGKSTLLVFFTTENKNAEASLTKIESLATGMKAKGLNVVGITHTSEVMTGPKIKEWLTAKSVTFPVALDKATTTSEAYKRSAPISAVIVKSGKIVWTGNPTRLADEDFARYL